MSNGHNERPRRPSSAAQVGTSSDRNAKWRFDMIWFLVLVLLLLAVGGGVFLSKFLFIVLVVALVVAVFGSRRTV
jgi:hypothetical protein